MNKECGVKNVSGEFFVPELSGGGDERKFKVEVTSELETFFQFTGFAFAAAACVLFFLAYAGGSELASYRGHLKTAGVIASALGALMAVLYKATDNYYIMDGSSRKILFNYRFLWFSKITPVIDFFDLYALFVTAAAVREDCLTYKIVAVTKRAAVITLSDYEKPDALAGLNKKAGAMAALAGCLYAECPQRGFFFIDHNGGDINKIRFDIK
ncbi:MAG TPA: hypothetical protein PK467_13065 [Candidatus Wallbacteria bacterium]|nr:hypothetical protein [Candidatus Wallbacteria bacterium]